MGGNGRYKNREKKMNKCRCNQASSRRVGRHAEKWRGRSATAKPHYASLAAWRDQTKGPAQGQRPRLKAKVRGQGQSTRPNRQEQRRGLAMVSTRSAVSTRPSMRPTRLLAAWRPSTPWRCCCLESKHSLAGWQELDETMSGASRSLTRKTSDGIHDSKEQITCCDPSRPFSI